MRRVKEPTVTLVTPEGRRKDFGIAHAERILDMGDELNGGWRVAEDSNYYYDEENGLRVKSDRTNTAETR